MNNSDVVEKVGVFLFFLIIFVSIVTLTLSAMQFQNRNDCEALFMDTGLNTRFDTTQGCLVEVNGEWIPEDKLVYLFPKFLEEQDGFPEREE